jgi:hypothetical protein
VLRRAQDLEGVVLDGAGWPLEPALESHLVDQASDTRGVLADGRTRFRLAPGPHQVILIRSTAEAQPVPVDVGKPLPFEVADPGPGEAEPLVHAFTVEGGR